MQPMDVERQKRALDDNYVLVFTTNSRERRAVSDCLQRSAKAVIPAENDGARLGTVGEQIVLHVTGTSGGQADKAVGRIARQLLRRPQMPRPKAVILIGVCWGAPKKTAFRTVILSGDVLAVNHLRFEGDQPTHVSFARSSPWSSEISDIASELRSVEEIAVTAGILASGEQFLARNAPRDALLKAYPSIIGGEMEGWDLVPDLEGLPWAQIRGVSDFAEDETDRSRQDEAAGAAAKFLEPLLERLQARERLNVTRRDPGVIGLLEVLSGGAMTIDNPGDGLSLKEHLNYRLGPSLAWRLAQYAIGTAAVPSTSRLLANLLLEIALNSLLHGGASRATIGFGDNSVTYRDDGAVFDVFSLEEHTAGRGGRNALALVRSELLAINAVHLASAPQNDTGQNSYCLTFPQLSRRLREARERCPLTITYDWGSRDELGVERLSYNPKCETLFFDATELIMSTHHFDVIPELQVLLSDGKAIIIQCFDKHDKVFYEDSLGSVSDGRLDVLVAPPMPTSGDLVKFDATRAGELR